MSLAPANRLGWYAVLALPLILLMAWFLSQVVGRLPPASRHLRDDGQRPTRVRDVRVLLAAGVKRLRVRTPGGFDVLDDRGEPVAFFARDTDWTVIRPGSQRHIVIQDRQLACSEVTLAPRAGGSLQFSSRQDDRWSLGFSYPGRLHISLDELGAFRAINLVDVESYVAGVVAGEIWPDFAVSACRAQAIAARSYVLDAMRRRTAARYDVVATQASQVYRGTRTDEVGRRAAEATAYTSGVVCTYAIDGVQRIIATYYAAACGGVTSSLAVFNGVEPIRPLAGGVLCTYCAIAPKETYRWGPVTLPLRDVLAKLVRRQPDLQSFSALRLVDVVRREPSGRPLSIRIVGVDGFSKEMPAERFRLALGADVVKSMYCDIRIDRGSLILENGKGSGHGVGMCQWGMQAQALTGRSAGQILRYYYPGVTLTRSH